ncbi:MAG: ATP-dependent helicase [Patescibacteria group bacterium]|nr:ATP-dependent helicase [Patescibacteria group bacterium]
MNEEQKVPTLTAGIPISDKLSEHRDNNGELLKGLNQEQKTAVTHGQGPLLIVAGAGTGKTAVITRRIAYLIEKKLAKPEEILALTFTDKAAEEMEERVDRLVPYGFVDTWISTFHAFGDRILRENALELGLPSDFKILSRPEQVIFMREHLFEFNLNFFRPLGNPTKFLEALLDNFFKLKDENISPKEYLGWVKEKGKREKDFSFGHSGDPDGGRERPESETKKDSSQAGMTNLRDQLSAEEIEKHLEIAEAYEKYQELMMKAGNLDFGDQLILSLRLLRDRKSVLKKYQDQFKYILVDEFQDTNFAQNELLVLLAGEKGNITVVGDDDQSIYRFRGAAISNIMQFKEVFPKAKQIVLTKNYRSSQAILDSAYKLIKFNDPDRLEVQNKVDKKLVAESDLENILPNHIHCDSVSSETDRLAELIKNEVSKGTSFKDIAVLVRANSQAESFMQALLAKGIPYKFAGSKGLYNQPEIKLVLAFIRSINDPFDSLSLYHLLTSELYNILTSEAILLTSHARKNNRTLAETIGSKGLVLTLETDDKISKILSDLEKYREMAREATCGQVVYAFLNESGYLKNLVGRAVKDSSIEVKIQNIAKFFEKITEFEYVSVDKSIQNFGKQVDDLISAGDDPATAEIDPDLDAVNILTVHKAKGLEFKIVFLVNLVNDAFPSKRKSDSLPLPEELLHEKLPERDFHLQEERRLFYVGMTRAREKLYLTSAEDYGGKRLRKVSQFVLEALDQSSVETSKYKLDKIEQIKKFAKASSESQIQKFYKEGKILNLTPHQIDDYLSCPLKFKYIHILEIPILKHHPVIYGSAIHKAVQEYFLKKINNQPVAAEDLIKAFEESWETQGWITREHEEKRFEEGKKSLAKFFESQEKEKYLPNLIESKFSFGLNFGVMKVKINGRYDAVYQNLGKEVEIRDFKTSEVTDQKTADGKAKSNRQLSVYALSYEKLNGKIPDKLSLHFIDSGLIGVAEKTAKDLEKVTEEIETVVKGITANDFKAAPGYGECSRCAYKDICPSVK